MKRKSWGYSMYGSASRAGQIQASPYLLGMCILLICGGCQKSQPAVQINIADVDRERIIRAADRYLNESPVTVTSFAAERSTGGLHDFYSEGDYWWPNPDDPEGP